MLVKLPCPIGSTLYRVDKRTRPCSYHDNTRDNLYYCINDTFGVCKHLYDGKCDAGTDYSIYTIRDASAMVILGNKDYIGTKVFLSKEDAETELAKKQEEERFLMLKNAKTLNYPYDSYYDYFDDDELEEDDE